MTEASQESMDSKLLHMGTYSKQIASHRQTHAHRAVPLDILRENGLSVRVTTTFGIPVVALKKIIKKYPITIHFNHDLMVNFVINAGLTSLDFRSVLYRSQPLP